MDGLFTYLGMTTFGAAIEANPIIAWYAGILGIGPGIVGAKAFSLTCGAILHANARHRTLVALTVLSLIVGVLPWTRILWP
jgi:hypothetical protein